MRDFERSGTTYDEQAKRRSPGTWFADMGDRLARGFNSIDRPPVEEPEWEEYEETEQPTAAVDALPWESSRKRFPTALHGYDRDAVDAHVDGLEAELEELRTQRLPVPAIEAELERVGEETSAILKVAHEQAAEITRRARAQADRCVADAAANAVAMGEDARRKLRQLDSETDAVWAERGRLIEDVRNVATALFSLAEDAADRFPEDGDRGPATAPAPVVPTSSPAPAPDATAPPAAYSGPIAGTPSGPGAATPSGPGAATLSGPGAATPSGPGAATPWSAPAPPPAEEAVDDEGSEGLPQ
ncbi:MAG: DivIVA domain-containing protein [Solirubrobacterales bacterium]|nr:DivIVA domain-containing protein [Solirubrobacterales bacterium]